MKSFAKASGPKQKCREILCKEAKKQLGEEPKAILTLPYKEILCVNTFRKHFPNVNIIGIEREKDIYHEINDKGVYCYNCDVREFAYKSTLLAPHFDIMFLDYYSYLNENVLKDLVSILKNRNIIHKNKSVILGLTLSKGMRDGGEAKEILRDFVWEGHKKGVANNLDEIGSAVLTYLEHFVPDLVGSQVLQDLEYKADPKRQSATMYFYCFLFKF